MGPLLLAVRELRRAKGRFALLTGAVGVLVFLVVFQQALLGGLVTEFVGAVRNQSADVLVLGEDARLNLQGSVVAPETVDEVAAVDGVEEAAPLGVATVTVELDDDLDDATVFGHALGGPGEPRELADGRRPERVLEAVASAGQGIRVGDRVAVQPGDVVLTVVGTANETSFSVTPTLFVSYATFEAVQLAVNPDAEAVVPSAVAVTTVDGADAGEVADRIGDEVDGIESVTRQEAADGAPGVSAVSQSFGVVLLLTYVVATIVTGFFFLILTVQKAPSLTLLRATGATAGRLVSSLAVQVLVVVALGLLLGTVLAAGALTNGGPGIDARIRPGALATTVVAVVVLAAIACVGAARRIARLDPADALVAHR